MKYTYSIDGMHCKACIEKIKSSLSPYVKVLEVKLNPPLLRIEASHPPLLDDLNIYIAKAGAYRLKALSTEIPSTQNMNATQKPSDGLGAYYPLFLIFLYIFGVSFLNNIHSELINWQGWMSQFMAGFFLVFSAFKFLDLPGFASGYATYDLLARRWRAYGFIYPFLELALGLLYLKNWLPMYTELLTIFIMGFSSLGVMQSLLKKQTIQCACLGTILKVPLSVITLVEDLAMVVLATFTLTLG